MAGQRGEGPSAQQHRGALSRLTSCLAAPRFGCMRNARLPAVDQVTKTDVQSDAVVAEFDQVQATDRQLHIAHKGLIPAQALGARGLDPAGIFAQLPSKPRSSEASRVGKGG